MALGVLLRAHFPLDPIAYLRSQTSSSLTLWDAGWRRHGTTGCPPLWPFLLTPQDWAQTPLAVHASVRALRDEGPQLHDGVETREARLLQQATPSSRPPSADAPAHHRCQAPHSGIGMKLSTCPHKRGVKIMRPWPLGFHSPLGFHTWPSLSPRMWLTTETDGHAHSIRSQKP